MTLRMERFSGKWGTRICLSGELRSQQLDDLRAEIEQCGPVVILDLDEVDVVDIDAVRFLIACEARDVEVVNCFALHQGVDVSRASDGKPPTGQAQLSHSD